MYIYLVFMPQGEEQIKAGFPDHYPIADGLWAVGTELRTSADVCGQLGIVPEGSGVVAKLTEYYGRFDNALWQKLESWSKA